MIKWTGWDFNPRPQPALIRCLYDLKLAVN
jgi:hypothetical protein